MDYFTLENIQVAFGDKKVLKGIDIEVGKGEFVSLLGPSGCGKSTFLKTIAGLIEPEAGKIYIDGRLANTLAPENRGTVIVFQDLRLFPHMNVRENIEFGLKMKGIDREVREQKSLQILAKVGLAGYERSRVRNLSGGQQQRVALARALVTEPELLLLDEPFSSLDENLRQKMRELVLELHREFELTTILVTHDQEEALAMSDRIAIMLNGEILQYDTPKAVYETPVCAEVADYFGEMNYFEGAVRSGQFRTDTFPHHNFSASLEDGNYLLMLKPHHIRLCSKPGMWRITSIRYGGEKSLVQVSDNQRELLISASSDQEIKIGDWVDIEPDQTKGVYY
jgi:ABC-type Fe3+/spermidine/putrescine transport system ATPase subunit